MRSTSSLMGGASIRPTQRTGDCREYEIRQSTGDDKQRAEHIDRLRAKRPRSNWRDVLAKLPEGGTRVEVR